jgi:MFS transporter, ACDE family, multidrug resistance protein
MRAPRPPGAGARIWPIYAGGFLGPFGGIMVTPMMPEVAAGLGSSVDAVARSITAYLVPFAGLMVVSGTLAERFGRRRSVRAAYLVYAAASVLCLAAPGIVPFMLGRSLQGAANAFTTPLLVAALTDVVAADRLGGAMGRFSSLQGAGVSFAPLIVGVLATVEWRAAFVASAVVGVLLAFVPPPDAVPLDAGAPPGTPPGAATPSRWRLLLNRRLALTCGVAVFAYFTMASLMLLSTLRAGDDFGLDPDARGLLIATIGLCGMATGWIVGRGLDRFGWRPFGLAAHLCLALAVALAGLAPSVALLAVAIGVAGVAGTASRVTVNALAAGSTPGNRGGASSMALAWLFLGGALAPLLVLPVYRAAPGLALPVAALGALAAAALLAATPDGDRRSRRGRGGAGWAHGRQQ